MADTKITKAPSGKVSSLAAPAWKSGNTYQSTWKNGSTLFSTKSNSRFEGHEWWWTIKLSNGKKTKTWTTKTTRGSGSSRTSAEVNIGSLTLHNGKKKGTADLYPNTSWHVVSITAHVRGWNSKGTGSAATSTRSLSNPKAPTVSPLSQGEENGHVSCTITCEDDPAKHYRPRTNTRYQRTVYDSRKTGKERSAVTDGTLSGTSGTVSYDVTDRQQLSYTQYVCITVKAWCRGIGGKSSEVTRTLYVSWPNQPSIKTGSVTCPARSSIGKVTVPINLGKTKEHPVTGVRLQKLVGVAYTKASQIPANAGWEDCGVADDGECTALSVASDEVLPEEGTRTWIRVKSWNQIEGLFVRYSAPMELANLYKASPTAEDDKCEIVSVESAADGTGAVVTVGYKSDGNTGTEVTWSDDPGAWESTEQPQSFEVTWDDEASKSGSWAKTTTLAVRGLDEGTEYHFRARRYLEGEEGTTHSPWSAQKSVTPALAPSAVVLSMPAYVARGQGCEAGWAYEGGVQKSWRLLCGGRVAAEGTDQTGSCAIDAETLERLAADDGTLSMTVEVTTSGGHAESEAVTVTLASPPALALSDAAVTAQPMAIPVASTAADAVVSVTVRAQGCTSSGPGQGDQVAGDVVWSQVTAPAWAESGDAALPYSATLEAPTGLDLRDGARYTVTASAVDPISGLASPDATCELAVLWARQAPAPTATVSARDVEGRDGTRDIYCEISIGTPAQAAAEDVCDVWRVTPDGEYMVYESAALGSTITDPWAPYGDDADGLAYRIVLRTADGDMEWTDVGYRLPARELRIDFGNDYVELPYNLKGNDSWEKDVRIQRKLDGHVDGYWNQGALRRAGLSTDLIRIEDGETARRVRSLARHAGPCLVRTPDGCCYCADVQVTDLSGSCDSALAAVSLDATEIALAGDYMAAPAADRE